MRRPELLGHTIRHIIHGFLGNHIEPLHLTRSLGDIDLSTANALNFLAVEDPAVGSPVGKVQPQGNRGWIALVNLLRDRQIDMGQTQRCIDIAIRHQRGSGLTRQDIFKDAACFPLERGL